MPFSFSAVDAFARGLAGVTVGTKWGARTWQVGTKGFAWERPLRKADLERLGDQTPPSGEILGVRTENLDAKDAILAMSLPGFFTIAHFNNYPAFLIELRTARASDVRVAIEQAHRAVTATRPRARRRSTRRERKSLKGRVARTRAARAHRP